MIQQTRGCYECPLLQYQGGGCYNCKHPNSKVGIIYNEKISAVHEKCPLKVVDLILTVKK